MTLTSDQCSQHCQRRRSSVVESKARTMNLRRPELQRRGCWGNVKHREGGRSDNDTHPLQQDHTKKVSLIFRNPQHNISAEAECQTPRSQRAVHIECTLPDHAGSCAVSSHRLCRVILNSGLGVPGPRVLVLYTCDVFSLVLQTFDCFTVLGPRKLYTETFQRLAASLSPPPSQGLLETCSLAADANLQAKVLLVLLVLDWWRWRL